MLAKLSQKSREIKLDSAYIGVQTAPARRLRRRLTPQETAELVARYKAGESSPALNKEYGILKCGLLQLLREERVSLRNQAMTPEDAERVARLYESGMVITEVVDQISYSYGTIRKVLHQSGVTLRPKGIKRGPGVRAK